MCAFFTIEVSPPTLSIPSRNYNENIYDKKLLSFIKFYFELKSIDKCDMINRISFHEILKMSENLVKMMIITKEVYNETKDIK